MLSIQSLASGVFAWSFTDFGDGWTTNDLTGEPPKVSEDLPLTNALTLALLALSSRALSLTHPHQALIPLSAE